MTSAVVLRPLLMLAVLLSPPAASDSPLALTAAAMKAGEWREITALTALDSPTLFQDGRGCGILSYSEDVIWNPATEQLFILGAGPGFSSGQIRGHFLTYHSRENRWEALPRPSLFPLTHAYDHHAVDPERQRLYHRPYASDTIYRYDIVRGSWSTLPKVPRPTLGYRQVAGALEFMPPLNGLVFINTDRALHFDLTLAEWRVLKQGMPGTYHQFAEYSPRHQTLLFGGGSTRSLYKLAANGDVTRLQDAPVAVGINHSVITADPVSGDYLVLAGSARRPQLYRYDITADRWTLISTQVPLFDFGEDDVENTAATPISNYGVNLFIRANCEHTEVRLFLYKHSDIPPQT